MHRHETRTRTCTDTHAHALKNSARTPLPLPTAQVGAPFAIGLVSLAIGPPQHEADRRLLEQLETNACVLLRGGGPRGMLGRAVAGLSEVPPHLRSQLISQVHVLCRLRSETPELSTPDQLRAYLQSCDGLLSRLAAEWWLIESLEVGDNDQVRWVGTELRSDYARDRP